jgi:antirestriction protein ArdC
MKKDVYQVVTDQIIKLLESGTIPWRKPWKGVNHVPRNLMSRKAYRGINLFLLNAASYSSPFWLTFRQAQALGGTIRKGEKSFPVVFWKLLEEERDGEKHHIPFLRYHPVFNVAQCDGIHVPIPEGIQQEFHPIKQCEEVVSHMPNAPRIQHGGEHALYSPPLDIVKMPDAPTFESAEAYYTTLFHELVHSTGHGSRLNRKEVTETNRFGSDPYSREELVAEMGAAFLSGHCGIEDKTLNQSASYIQSWLEKLKDDRRLVVQAAALAQKASDYILERVNEEEGQPDSVQEISEPALACESAVPATMMKTRRIKIEEDGSPWKGKRKSKIRLRGLWLQNAGFISGNYARVESRGVGIIELRANDLA